MEQIKPCPFCKQKRVEPIDGCYRCSTLYVSGGDAPRAVCIVRCTGCGAEGPVSCTEHKYTRKPSGAEARAVWDAEAARAEAEAVRLWNEAPR